MGVASSSQLVFIGVERPFNLTLEEDEGIYAEIAIEDDIYEITSWPTPPITVVLENQGPELLQPQKLLRCSFWAADGDGEASKKRNCMEVLIPQSSIEEFGQPALQLWLGLLDQSEMPSERYPPEEQAKFLFEASLQAAKSRWRPKVCITIAVTAEDLHPPTPLTSRGFDWSCFRSCDGDMMGDSCTGRYEVVPLYLEDEQDPFDGALEGPIMKLLKHNGDIIKELCAEFRTAERDLMYTRKEFKSKEMIYHGQMANLLGNKRDLRLTLLRVRDIFCENWLETDSLFFAQRAFTAWSKATFSGALGALRELLPSTSRVGAMDDKPEPDIKVTVASVKAPNIKQLLGFVLKGTAMELRMAFQSWHDVTCIVQKPAAVQASPQDARRAGINRTLAFLETTCESYMLQSIFTKWNEQVATSHKMDMESLLLVDRRQGRQAMAEETLALLEPARRKHLLGDVFLKWQEVLLRGHKVDMENLLLAAHPEMCQAHFSRVAWALHRCAEDQSTLQLQMCFVAWQRICEERSRKAVQCAPDAGDVFIVVCTFHRWARLARRARQKATVLGRAFDGIERYTLWACFVAWRRCGGKGWRKALLRCISASDAFLFTMAFHAWSKCVTRCREEAAVEKERSLLTAEAQRRHDHLVGMAAEWLDGTHVTMFLEEVMRGWHHCVREEAHGAVVADLRKLKEVHDLQHERTLQLMEMDEVDFQRRCYFQRWRSYVAESKQEMERSRLEALQSCLSEAQLRNKHSLRKVLLRVSDDSDQLLLRCIVQAWTREVLLHREAAAQTAEKQLLQQSTSEYLAQCRSFEAQLEAATVRADSERETHAQQLSKVVNDRLSFEDCGFLTLVFLRWRHHCLNEKMESMVRCHLEAADRLTTQHVDALAAKELQLEAAAQHTEQLCLMQKEELTSSAERRAQELRQHHDMTLSKLVDHLDWAFSSTSLSLAFASWRESAADSARQRRLRVEQERGGALLEGSWSAWSRLTDQISLRMALHAWYGELGQMRTLQACRERSGQAQQLVARLALEHLAGSERCVLLAWRAHVSERALEAQAASRLASADERHRILVERSIAAWGQSESLASVQWVLHTWASAAASSTRERQMEASHRRGEHAQRLVASLALEHLAGNVRCAFLAWRALAAASAREAQADCRVSSVQERHRFLLERSLAAWGQSESLADLRWLLRFWASAAACERERELRHLQSAHVHKLVDYLFLEHLAGSLRSAFYSWREHALDSVRAAEFERKLLASRERHTSLLERSLAAWGQEDQASVLQRLFLVWTQAVAQEHQLKLCRLQSSHVHKLVDYLALEHLAGSLRAAFLSWQAHAADLVRAAQHNRQLSASRERHHLLLERSVFAWGRCDSLGALQVVLRSWSSVASRERLLKERLFFRAWCEVVEDQRLIAMKEALADAAAHAVQEEHQRAHRLLDYLILDEIAGALRTTFLYWREFASSAARMSQFDRQLLAAREKHCHLLEKSLVAWTQGNTHASLQVMVRNWKAEAAKQHRFKVAFWFRAWRRATDAALQLQLDRLRSARTQKVVQFVMLTHAAGSLRSTLYWWKEYTMEAARAAQLGRRNSGVPPPHCLLLDRALMVWLRGNREATLQLVLGIWRTEVDRGRELQAHRKQLRHLQGERTQKLLDCMVLECMVGSLASTFLCWREHTTALARMKQHMRTEEQHNLVLERSMLQWVQSESQAVVHMMVRLWSAETRRTRRFKALLCFRAWYGAVEDARLTQLRELESARVHKVVHSLMMEHVAGSLQTAFLCWRERAQSDRRLSAAQARQDRLLERSLVAWVQGSGRTFARTVLGLWAAAVARQRGIKAQSMHARQLVELLALHLMAGSARSSFLCWRERTLSAARARSSEGTLASLQKQHCLVLERSLMLWVHSESTVSAQLAFHVWWAEATRMRQLKAQQLELLRLQSGRAQRLVDALMVTHMVGSLQSTFMCWREHTSALRRAASCDRLLVSQRQGHGLVLERSMLAWVEKDGRSALRMIVRVWSTEARRRRVLQEFTYFRAWCGVVEAGRQTQIHRLQSRRACKLMDYLMLQHIAGCLSGAFLSWKELASNALREARYTSECSVERARHRESLERSLMAWARTGSEASLHMVLHVWSAQAAGVRQLKVQSGHAQRFLEYLLVEQLAGSLRSSFCSWRQYTAAQVMAAQNGRLLSSTQEHEQRMLEKSLLVWVREESMAGLQIMLRMWSAEAKRKRLLTVQLYFRSWCSAVEAARHEQVRESQSVCMHKLVDYFLLEHIAGSLRSAFRCWKEQAVEFALAAQFTRKLEQQGELLERSLMALAQDSSVALLQMLFHIWRAEVAGSREVKAQRAQLRRLQGGRAERLVDYLLSEQLAGSLRSSFTCWRESTLAASAGHRLASAEAEHGIVLERSLLLWVQSESQSGLQIVFCLWRAEAEKRRELKAHQLEQRRLQSGRAQQLVELLLLDQMAGSLKSTFASWRQHTEAHVRVAQGDRALSMVQEHDHLMLERSMVFWVQGESMAALRMILRLWSAEARRKRQLTVLVYFRSWCSAVDATKRTQLHRLQSGRVHKLVDYLMLEHAAGGLRGAFQHWREQTLDSAQRAVFDRELSRQGLLLERSMLAWVQDNCMALSQMVLWRWRSAAAGVHQVKVQTQQLRRRQSGCTQRLMDYLLLEHLAGTLRSAFMCWKEHALAESRVALANRCLALSEEEHGIMLERSLVLWAQGESKVSLQVVFCLWWAEASRAGQLKAQRLELRRLGCGRAQKFLDYLLLDQLAGSLRSVFSCWREHAVAMATQAMADQRFSYMEAQMGLTLDKSVMLWCRGQSEAAIQLTLHAWAAEVGRQHRLKVLSYFRAWSGHVRAAKHMELHRLQSRNVTRLVDHLMLEQVAGLLRSSFLHWREEVLQLANAARRAEELSRQSLILERSLMAWVQGDSKVLLHMMLCLWLATAAGEREMKAQKLQMRQLQHGQREKIVDYLVLNNTALLCLAAWREATADSQRVATREALADAAAKVVQGARGRISQVLGCLLREQDEGLLRWTVSCWRELSLQSGWAAELERTREQQTRALSEQDLRTKRLDQLLERSISAWISADRNISIRSAFFAWSAEVAKLRQLRERARRATALLSALQLGSDTMCLVYLFREWIECTEESRRDRLLTKATEMTEKVRKMHDKANEEMAMSPTRSARTMNLRAFQMTRVASSPRQVAGWETWSQRRSLKRIWHEWRCQTKRHAGELLRDECKKSTLRLAEVTEQRAALLLAHKSNVHRLLERCFRSEASEELGGLFSQWRLHASAARRDETVRSRLLALHESISRLLDKSLAAWGAQLDRELLTEAVLAWQAGAAECRAFVAQSECRAAQQVAETRLSDASAKAERLQQAHWEGVLKLFQQRILGICFRCWVTHASCERQARGLGSSVASSGSRISAVGSDSQELSGEDSKLLLRSVEHENRALQQLLLLRGWHGSLRTRAAAAQPEFTSVDTRPACKRLLFGILSFESGVTVRMIFVGWREHVSRQQKLDFCQAQLTADLRTSNLVDVACGRWQAGEAMMILRTVVRIWRGCVRPPTPRSSRGPPKYVPGSAEKAFSAHRKSRVAFASKLIEGEEKAFQRDSAVESKVAVQVTALQEQCKLQNHELEDLSAEVGRLERHLAKASLLLDAQQAEQAAPKLDLDTKMLFEHCALQSKQLQELECELDLLHAKMAAEQEEAAQGSNTEGSVLIEIF